MRKITLLTILVFSIFLSKAQTYTSVSGGSIPDGGPQIAFPLTVSGLSPTTIDTLFGLETICININHSWSYDLAIAIQSPDGNIVDLSVNNGWGGSDYTNTCFNGFAATSIVMGVPPFTGTFRPQGYIGSLNNGQVGNGVWNLLITDYSFGDIGNLISWNITFGNTPSKPFPFYSSNLPIVVLNTLGQTIKDDPKITCDMGIIYNGVGVRNNITDAFNNYNGKIAIEIRGSTSQQYPKKSYGVETRDALGAKLNVSLLGLPSENDWILYGAYPDKTLMRNEITYDLFSKMQPYSPRYVYCELVINNQYMGVYTLLERVKRDKDRVDIAKLDFDDNAGDSLTGGYIIKVDKVTGSSSTTWTSPYQPKVKFLYHDPEDIELTVPQLNYIQNYVTNFENVVYGPTFSDLTTGFRAYTNVGSFVDFFLMQELGRTVDGYRSSSFMYKDKDSKGGKLSCGPMWDFNLSYGNADYCDAFDTTGWQYDFATVCPTFTSEPPNWWSRLLQDTAYANQVKCRWTELRMGILDTDSINIWIDSIALYLNESQQRNFTLWPIMGTYVNWNYFIGANYQEEVDYLKWWFQARSQWMDTNLPSLCWNLSAPEHNSEKANVKIFPNPFLSTTTFTFTYEHDSEKELEIYDMLGKKIKTLLIPNGKNSITINSDDMNSGMYFYQLKDSEKIIATGKLISQ